MLALSRQLYETITIGGEIEVMVTDIRGDRVTLGFTAPRHVEIHRKELYHRLLLERAKAANGKPDTAPSPLDACKIAAVLMASTPDQIDLRKIAEAVNAAIRKAEPGWDGRLPASVVVPRTTELQTAPQAKRAARDIREFPKGVTHV